MPTVALFYGIAIRMYFNDHEAPHFHAVYGRSNVIVRISDGHIVRGVLPPGARALGKNCRARWSWLSCRWSMS